MALTHLAQREEEAGLITCQSYNKISDLFHSARFLIARPPSSKGRQIFVQATFDPNLFADVFPEELPGIPPDRDVEFVIDLL